MAKRPYMAIYPGDLLKDPCVVPLSLEAKGFWMLMLFAMHELDTGTLTGTLEDFARRAGGERPAKIKRIITELERYGTADIKRAGRDISVTCRRLSRECRGREYERNRKQAQRLKKVSRECPGDGPGVSRDMSVSSSISCTEETHDLECSSSADGQQQQPDWPNVIKDRQSRSPDKNVRRSWEKFMAMPGEKTVPGFDKWLGREWPAPKISPIRPGVRVGTSTPKPAVGNLTEQERIDLIALFQSIPNHEAEMEQLLQFKVVA